MGGRLMATSFHPGESASVRCTSIPDGCPVLESGVFQGVPNEISQLVQELLFQVWLRDEYIADLEDRLSKCMRRLPEPDRLSFSTSSRPSFSTPRAFGASGSSAGPVPCRDTPVAEQVLAGLAHFREQNAAGPVPRQ